MAATPSTMLPLGTKAPGFELPIVTGGTLDLEAYIKYSKGVVTAFICNHCPYVKHINRRLVEISNIYINKGIPFIAISSNDADSYPEDGPTAMKVHAKEMGYSFPYVYDETQEVAKAYQTACTPDFYFFDRNRLLIYRGQFDSTRPKMDLPATGQDLINAIERYLSGKEIRQEQVPSIGCNIKWKPGNEPNYFL